jgi:putative DNA primase/helicase
MSPKAPPLDIKAFLFEEFIEAQFPPKKMFLHPWLTEKSITLISGWRGIGKTFMGLAIVSAVSKGQQFGPWKTETPVKCMYIDGELPKEDMQERAQEMSICSGSVTPAYIYSNDHASSMGLAQANLLDAVWRKAMLLYLVDMEIKLVVIDNISSLAPGIDESRKDEWDPVNQWLLQLRFHGISVILLHHVGKKGDQRGTSGREDNIDTSIILKHPDGYTPADGCRFITRFTKNRVRSGDHHLITDLQFDYQAGSWNWEQAQKDAKFDVYEMLDKGLSQKKIASELGLSQGRVSQIKHEAVLDGILDKNGKLTTVGWAVVDG